MSVLVYIYTIYSYVYFEKWTSVPGGIRTPDLLVRSQILYPTELLGRKHRGAVFVTVPSEGIEPPSSVP